MHKIYLILGAASDLGTKLVENLISLDSENVILAHYHKSMGGLDRIIDANPDAHIRCISADLSSIDETKKMIDVLLKGNIHPTHIINFAASAYKFNRLSELDVTRICEDMNIQVYSLALICKALIPFMVENKYGKIVVMLSSATKGIPPKYTTEYTIVKYAVLGLVKGLAADYGDMGICVNGISPGMIETKFIKGIGRKIKEVTAEKSPQHRNLQIDDVIPAVIFLLSENSTFMNGTNLNLTGTVE